MTLSISSSFDIPPLAITLVPPILQTFSSDTISGPSSVPSFETFVVKNSEKPCCTNSFVVSSNFIPVFLCQP